MDLETPQNKNGNSEFIDIQTLQALEELSSPGESSLLLELTQLFKETTPTLLAELDTAINSSQLEKALKLAHRIKGSAANIGAKQTAKLCADLEKKALKNSIEENNNIMTEIAASFQISCNEISNWISQNIQ